MYVGMNVLKIFVFYIHIYPQKEENSCFVGFEIFMVMTMENMWSFGMYTDIPKECTAPIFGVEE
jgi:hypothetical protein